MAPRAPFTTAELNTFNAAYDTSREDLALQTRGAFLRAFPQNRLWDLTIDTYVIGLQSPTFCDYVEVKDPLLGNHSGSDRIQVRDIFRQDQIGPTTDLSIYQ